MIVQYRIKNVGGKFYPQVRAKISWRWTKWKRIGKHTDGFGLYSYDGHPADFYDCEKVINEYHAAERHTTYATIFPSE